MLKRTFQFLMLACLSCSLCWAANDPFVGKWKLNSSKTHLFDVMKVAAAGADKYSFIFEGTDSETIVIDGTDQPGLQGTTLSVTIEGPRSWKWKLYIKKTKSRYHAGTQALFRPQDFGTDRQPNWQKQAGHHCLR